MANLQRILGALVSTGMGGRNRRGPSFGKAALGGGLLGGLSGGGMLKGAGLGVLGTLAYNAYQQYQSQAEGQSRETAAAGQTDVGLEDGKALQLIRAMIAAANADGQIDAAERRRITEKLKEAGADEDDRAFVEREMESPVALDELLRQVQGEEGAEQFYLASELAIDANTDAERSYLQYLADRLGIPDDRIQELNRMAG